MRSAALQFMQENGPDGPGAAESVFVGGDSAGGGLMLATLLAARERGVAMPDGGVGISVWSDLAITGESIQTRSGTDPLITDASMVTNMAAMYLGDADPETPLASPLYADYAGLPPLILQVGDHEVLALRHDAGRRTGARGGRRGRPKRSGTRCSTSGTRSHRCCRKASQAIDRIGEFINQHA